MSQLSVDSITGRVAGTSPTFPNGLNVTNGMSVTGVITATLLNQNVTGVTTFSSTTFTDGFSVTGVVTATSFSGNLSGNITGDTQVGGALTVTGDLTVNGTTTTIDTVVTAVDSLTVDGSVTAGGDVNVGAALSAADYQGNFILDTYLFS